MPYTKTILCLANSRKLSGRCVAGKERIGPNFTTWIRPVSNRPTRELSEEDRRYDNGDDPDILDIVQIEMSAPCPETYQTENHLIDENYYWQRVGRGTWQQLLGGIDNVTGPLWNRGGSTYYGINDQVPESVANSMGHSLLLVHPSSLMISVSREGGTFSPTKRKVRGLFSINNIQYKLLVTDPFTEHAYLRGLDGVFYIQDVILCVSLGEIFHGYAYKLIATVITPERAEGTNV